MSACYKLLPKNLINYLWKCSIYVLNKILSVFDCCWSVCPVTSGLLFSLTLCLFRWKTIYKKRLPHFPVFGNLKKIGQRKAISGQWKTLTKMSLIFYRLFFKKKILENNLSFARCITLIALSLLLFPLLFLSSHILTVTPSGLFSSYIFHPICLSPLFSPGFSSPL